MSYMATHIHTCPKNGHMRARARYGATMPGKPRPIAQSLFPDLKPDVAIGPIPESVQVGSNADLLALIGPMYLEGGSVLDVTYGRGKWWTRWRPEDFTFHDLASDGVDFTDLPYPADSYDAVVYDPPYVAAGGPATSGNAPSFRASYGIEPCRSIRELDQLIEGGLVEACRVARSWVLVKCSDYTAGAQLQLGHVKVITWAEALGWTTHDLIVHWTAPGPGGHNIKIPQRFRRAHSYLLVLKPAQRRKPS